MTQINSYLTFNGNCREAMTFYKDCLGGTLVLQTVDESPMADKMPPQMKESIMHASLTSNSIMLMGSDMCSDKGLIKGNNVSLCINCSSEEEAKTFYSNLSKGGEATHELQPSFWGGLFGDLIDKFGVQWMVNHTKNQ